MTPSPLLRLQFYEITTKYGIYWVCMPRLITPEDEEWISPEDFSQYK